MFVSKTTQLNTPFIYGTLLLNLAAIWTYSSGELLCPTITELDSPVNLTCSQAFHTGAHSYSTPSGTTAASCDLAENRCIPLGDFTATVVNMSSSTLAIPRLLLTHAGVWTCVVDADAPSPDTCHITVQKSPACRITSKQSTRTVAVGQEISLTITLTGYYCSETTNVHMKTGGITSALLNETVTSLTDSTENITLNITTSHIGAVDLVFSCGSNSQVMSCEGVQELVQTIPGTSTLNADVTNTTATEKDTTSTEKESTDEDYLTFISAVVFPIAITVLIAIVVVLVRRRWHNNAAQPAKEYDDVHYVHEADPSVPRGSEEHETGTA